MFRIRSLTLCFALSLWSQALFAQPGAEAGTEYGDFARLFEHLRDPEQATQTFYQTLDRLRREDPESGRLLERLYTDVVDLRAQMRGE